MFQAYFEVFYSSLFEDIISELKINRYLTVVGQAIVIKGNQ